MWPPCDAISAKTRSSKPHSATAGVQLQSLAHTRWASNGVISLPNCHPVDSSVLRDGDIDAGSLGNMVAVLNGDIDNYQQLVERYVMGSGLGTRPVDHDRRQEIIPGRRRPLLSPVDAARGGLPAGLRRV